MIVWAPWHPKHGYDLPPDLTGLADVGQPVAYAELSPSLRRLIFALNERDATTNRTGWRAIKTNLVRAP